MNLPVQIFKLPFALLPVLAFVGCGMGPNLSSSLESDELYLVSGEEFITDAEYMAFASKDLQSFDSDDYYYEDSNDNNSSSDNYSSGMGNFNQYGGLGLGSYFNPFGGNNYGYGNNNGYGNNFGYGNNNGFGNNFGYGNNNGFGNNYWNNYGYGNNFGYGNNYGSGGGYYGSGTYSGGETYYTSSILVGPRTPLLTGTLTNSNYTGGRLRTNRTEEVNTDVNTTSDKPSAKKNRSIWNWETPYTSTESVRSNTTRTPRTNTSTENNNPSRSNTPVINSRSNTNNSNSRSSGTSTRTSGSRSNSGKSSNSSNRTGGRRP